MRMAVDPYTQALFDLKGEVGQLRGEMTGIGREIGDIKRLLETNTTSCRSCRDGIDHALDAQAVIFTDRLDAQDRKIAPIENLHVGEKAVQSWQDRTFGEIATAIGAGAGIIALVAWIARGIVTGDWY
jgi:hypothetical protein